MSPGSDPCSIRTCMTHLTSFFNLACGLRHRARCRGVALVTILAVLTVLAILAATLTVLMQVEITGAALQQSQLTAELIVNTGVAHAEALLCTADTFIPPPAANGWKQTARTPGGCVIDAVKTFPWINVRDANGTVCGRYRMTIEDEGGKVNLNTAYLLEPSRGVSWNSGEVSLPQALGISSSLAKRLVDYRYGSNGVPGARGDDDQNNAFLMCDGIDNNANGIVDEEDEGVDDPGEYNPWHPLGDDSRFTTVADAIATLLNTQPRLPLVVQSRLMREIPKRATVHSLDMPGSLTLPHEKPCDLNCVTVRECRQRLTTAQSQAPFEGSSARLAELAANIIDYRDQNHVLSTVGASYGVEAVCFNELLANDGTEGRYTASSLNCWYQRGTYNTDDLRPDNPDFTIGTASLFYEFQAPPMNAGNRSQKINDAFMRKLHYRSSADNANFPLEGGWDVEVLGSRRIRLLGPSKRFDSNGNETTSIWSGDRLTRYNYYRKIRTQIGFMQPISHMGDPGVGRSYRYESFRWPSDLFKNCYVSVANTGWNIGWFQYTDPKGTFIFFLPGCVKITGNTPDGVLTLDRPISPSSLPGPQTNATRCVIWGWKCDTRSSAWMPNMAQILTVQALQPGKYYQPYANGWYASDAPKVRFGFAEYPAVWSDDRTCIGSSKRWPYGGDGDRTTPVRATPGGFLDLGFKSGSDLHEITYDQLTRGGNAINGVTLVRPEVMELINVSPRPISLKNWTLTFNSGSIVNDIGQIDSCAGYGAGPGGRGVNPIIDGNGYFYLVNDMKLFNAEFGSKRPELWGRNASQSVPVWQLPSDSWGVQYRISRVVFPDLNHCRIYVPNESFKENQFRGDVLELQDIERPADRKNAAHGSRFAVQKSGRDWFEFFFDRVQYEQYRFDKRQPSFIDTVMVLGMPAKGGVVSMTLKNEYKQITARTVEYAYRDEDPRRWYGQSTEKLDPTHYLWTMRRTPSFSGNPLLARNHTQRATTGPDIQIKNGPFNSVAELRRVRHGEQFENIGEGGSKAKSQRTLAALMNVFSAGHIRLEAGDDLCIRSGNWRVGSGRVRSARNGQIVAMDAAWEIDQWRGHTLTFLTGPLRGESYPINGNTAASLNLRAGEVVPRSTPGHKLPTPNPGDRFAIGPGYATPLCYTRTSNSRGEWLWRRRVPVPGNYDLYIFGLNDAINTTEMLEENRNAPLDVSAWNYWSNVWDTICLRGMYGKDDSFRAGKIGPQHVSADGDFKLQLVAHNVVAEQSTDVKWENGMQRALARRSGYGWFNYAALAPAPVIGRVNVNTADSRLLQALPAVSPALAHAIVDGLDSNGRPLLKPYRSPGDLLAVRGMTQEILERCVNLIAFDSSTFTVQVDAQAIRDNDRDGVFDPARGDVVLAQKTSRRTIRVGYDSRSHDVRLLEQR